MLACDSLIRRVKMNRVYATLVLLLSLIALDGAYADGPPPTPTPAPVSLTLTAGHPQLVNQESMSLVLSLKSSSFGGGTIQFNVPSGCTVTPNTVDIVPFTDLYETTKPAVTCSDGEGSKTVRAQLVRTTPSPITVVTSGSVSFDYVHRIEVWRYFLLGGLGIVVGYLVRIVMQIQKDIGPPHNPLTAEEEKDGPITLFVKEHYYWVDFAVAETLGLLSMLLLLKNDHVPDTSAHWYEALALGVGLGLLANTDLVATHQVKSVVTEVVTPLRSLLRVAVSRTALRSSRHVRAVRHVCQAVQCGR
jgi:hypothetical protein